MPVDWVTPSAAWIEFARHVSSNFALLGFSLRVTGQQHMPMTGPVLLVANHESYLDPWFIGITTPRHLAYLARKTLFDIPILGTLLYSFGCVPIDQEGIGKAGLQTILGEMQRGRAVLVFPEGTRSENGEMSPLKPGVGLLIKRMPEAWVLPVGVAGCYEAWPLWRKWPYLAPIALPGAGTCAVSFGKPRRASELAALGREEMLAAMEADIRAEMARAEALRGKP